MGRIRRRHIFISPIEMGEYPRSGGGGGGAERRRFA
jgi:hypothetical protein